MTATRGDVKRWIKEARDQKATHLIVAVDQFDHDNYPVYVSQDKDVKKEETRIRLQSMQSIDEIYSFTGKHTIDDQLSEHRACHYD